MKDSPRTAFFDVRGLELAYHTWGSPEDPAIVLLHGIADHGLAFARMVEVMAGAYFVVGLDLRGHGRSGWIGSGGYYHFYDHYGDALSLIEHLDLERLSIVGHSMGGSVAIGVAAALGDRVDALVLLEGIGRRFQEQDDALRRLLAWHAALSRANVSGDTDARRCARRPMKDLEDAALRLRRLNPRLSIDGSLALARTATEPAGGDRVVWRFDPLHRTPAIKPLLRGESEAMCREVRAPVLSLYGEDSAWKRRALDRNRLFRSGRIAVVKDAGHNLHHDRPEVLARVVTDWTEGRYDAIWPGVERLDQAADDRIPEVSP